MPSSLVSKQMRTVDLQPSCRRRVSSFEHRWSRPQEKSAVIEPAYSTLDERGQIGPNFANMYPKSSRDRPEFGQFRRNLFKVLGSIRDQVGVNLGSVRRRLWDNGAIPRSASPPSPPGSLLVVRPTRIALGGAGCVAIRGAGHRADRPGHGHTSKPTRTTSAQAAFPLDFGDDVST